MAIDFKVIGSRIQNIRKNKRITQEMLAEKLYVSVGYISQIERGITKVNLETLSEICTILDCELSYLVSGVIRNEREYLKSEFEIKYNTLNDKEKHIVLSLMDSLIDNR